jgi:hypothetical protein
LFSENSQSITNGFCGRGLGTTSCDLITGKTYPKGSEWRVAPENLTIWNGFGTKLTTSPRDARPIEKYDDPEQAAAALH